MYSRPKVHLKELDIGDGVLVFLQLEATITTSVCNIGATKTKSSTTGEMAK